MIATVAGRTGNPERMADFMRAQAAATARLTVVEAKARFSATPCEPGAPAPSMGRHTDEILAELGRGTQIAEPREAAVVA